MIYPLWPCSPFGFFMMYATLPLAVLGTMAGIGQDAADRHDKYMRERYPRFCRDDIPDRSYYA